MRERLRSPTVLVVVALVLLAGGLLAYDAMSDRGEPDRASVTVVDGESSGGADATLGVVEVRIADTYSERYTGLSNTESLGPNEGMLFVHDAEGEFAYVMRDMAFPIDIVFVGANRTITAIHHAETEDRPYTRYRGTGRYVLEVPYEWTTDHGVAVGDRIAIDWAGQDPTANSTGSASA